MSAGRGPNNATSEPLGTGREDGAGDAFGVYIHWPFCTRICPYCDFNVRRDRGVDEGAWRAALTNDLARQASLTGRRPVTSIYFGGGTPSLMSADLVGALIERCDALWGMGDDVEITLEANPEAGAAARFADFAAAGVNRLSLGAQSFSDAALAFLGRNHDAAQARAAIEAAAAAFDRHTFDLIYGRPDQSTEDWAAELDLALDLARDHLSLYQLTIEPGTAFARAAARGRLAPLGEDAAAAQFDLAREHCAKAGLVDYEVSNFARPGGEGRHNLLYWRYRDYAGAGPGAHGRLTIGGEKHAAETVADPKRYLEAARGGDAFSVLAPLSPLDQLRELLAMGLRLREGASLARIRGLIAKGAPPLDDSALETLSRQGLIEPSEGRLRATATGRRVLDAVTAALAP
ncbi:MAG: radical SAM family heme chaperone HemW [Parvularculaceae bacterium]